MQLLFLNILTNVFPVVTISVGEGGANVNVVVFRPSEAAQERLTDLLALAKDDELSPEEKSELDRYLQLEHLMRLAKARARDFLPNE